MKKISNLWLVAVMMFITTTIFAQVSGNVSDESGPLADVNVKVKGTDKGTTTDFDGNFTIKNTKAGVLVVSYLGYTTKEVPFKAGDKVNISLQEDGESLGEIVISGVVDIAKDRQTPVAVSTIKAIEIIDKLGSQEFPEMLNNTPSVYATKSGGGFGDARMNIRGFSQENIAVMINGVPVNDMENGRVYWSNWAGLSDVTTAMQVQRGLGSSKISISSVGGTVNIVTKTTDKKEGGAVSGSYGNDNYLKTMATYSTGKMKSGFATSVLLSRTTGDGYVNGTQFEGYNYFLGFGYDKGDHNFQFTITGAPQTHNQRTTSYYNMATLADYQKFGHKYNYNHGYLNGEEFNWRKNFYHKPIAFFNWEWDMSEKSKVSAVAYASFGRGGGTGDIGRMGHKYNYASSSKFRSPQTGEVLWDEIVNANSGVGGNFNNYSYTNTPDPITGTHIVNDEGLSSDDIAGLSQYNGIIRRASMNSHNWFGVLANFNHELSESLKMDFGIDIRSYKGIHYRRIDNLLGADGYRDNDNINAPLNIVAQENSSDLSSLWNVFKPIDDDQKINYYNEGHVRWYGAFGQLEYNQDALSAFVQASVSMQGFQRVDYFNYLDSDPDQTSDWEDILGGNIKGGINYNFTDRHNIFANAGYYTKQPGFDAIFLNHKNELNPDYVNEKILGFEIGYGYRTQKTKANINLYRTSWSDRFLSIDYENPDTGEEGSADMQGIKQVHMGIEFDVEYKITDALKLAGMMSIADWQYEGNSTGRAFDSSQNYIGDAELYLDGVKVGDAAQFTSRLGLEYKFAKGFKFDISQRYVDKLYAKINAEDFGYEDHKGSLQLPGYALMDTGISYKLNLKGSKSVKFRLNVNNLTDTEYIAESATNYHPGDKYNNDSYMGVNTKNKVFFGFGRTWNASIRFNF